MKNAKKVTVYLNCDVSFVYIYMYITVIWILILECTYVVISSMIHLFADPCFLWEGQEFLAGEGCCQFCQLSFPVMVRGPQCQPVWPIPGSDVHLLVQCTFWLQSALLIWGASLLSSYPGVSCLLHHSFLFLGSGFVLGLLQCIPAILGIGQGEFPLLSRYCPLEVASSVCPPALPSWPMGRVPGHHQCIWCFLLGLPSWSLVRPELPQGGIFLPAFLCWRRMEKGGVLH